MDETDKRFPIVGIGASAGGVPALEGFFGGLAAVEDVNVAFVVVTHLDPDRESFLHRVIARQTQLPVQIAAEGMRVEPGHVYVMPAGAFLTIEGGTLHAAPTPASRAERKPVDVFLAALAADQGDRAVGVILSGSNGDGTLGMKAIKEHAGLTLAQVPGETDLRSPDMPEAAIATGIVDFALPAEKMGAKIVELARGIELLGDLENDAATDTRRRILERARGTIFTILRNQTGHDFCDYKEKTLLRRIRRRMQITACHDIDAYVERLRKEPAEVDSLFRDLLINVTSFFRDPEAFDALERIVVPRLLDNRRPGDTVRVWIPGCATGEEVYSIAILLREHAEAMQAPPRIQVFGTDIDENALTAARAGRYPEALLEGVGPERRERFFQRDGSSYVIAKTIREDCIFSPHSVIRDPPFSRMDLVSCRNLLIYFGPELQHRTIPTFHYALRPGGFLFLGTSESIGQHAELFSVADKGARIYQKRSDIQTPALPLSLIAESRIGRNVVMSGDPSRTSSGYPLRHLVEAQVLEHFAPAHVVVNADGDIVYFSARTGRFLEPPAGAPSRQLLAMARRGLRLDLRAALREAVETDRSAQRGNIALEDADGGQRLVRIAVEPLSDQAYGEPLYLVLFSDLDGTDDPAILGQAGDRDDDGRMELERELVETRERLQSTIEEYETAVEELKASNEELVSINEEAQSTNEELEASKEEMQSLNEELNTINAELSAKVDELAEVNADLRNLFDSIQIATVFLDGELVIRNFNPAAAALFKLREGDVGRPLTDLSGHHEYPELETHMRQVLETGARIERQLPPDENDTSYLVRLVPYRDADGATIGVVVSFVDVSEIARAEAHQRVLIQELNHRVKNMLAVVVSITRLTAKTATSPQRFADALVGRFQAMARAYELLSAKEWTAIDLAELVREQVLPMDGDRTSLEGPGLSLSPQEALAVGMVLHELATNAAKHGALSAETGRLAVSWRLDGKDLVLRWQETGGPPAPARGDGGFGIALVENETRNRLHGTIDWDFSDDGLTAVLTFAPAAASGTRAG